MDTSASPRPAPSACPHFDPLDPAFASDPYPAYAALRHDAPVSYDEKLGVWVVSRYDDVLLVLKEPDTFSSRGALLAAGEFPPPVKDVLARGIGMGTVLTEADGPAHTRIRSVFNRPFASVRVATMEPRIRAVADGLIDGFADADRADLVSRFTSLLPGLVLCDLLGFPREDFPALQAWDDCWVSLLSFDATEDEQVRCAHGLLAYEQYVYRHLLARRDDPREDLLTAMLPADLGGAAPLTVGEAVYNVIDAVMSGYGTTARLITNAVTELFAHRDQYDRIRTDPVALGRFQEELLRVANPVQGIFRITTRPVELGGTRLPAAARVFLLYGSANFDEGHFANPAALDVERPNIRRHLTFSDGIHVCVGAALVRLTLRVALELLPERLPNLRPDADEEPRRLRHVFLRSYTTLPVQWDPPSCHVPAPGADESGS